MPETPDLDPSELSTDPGAAPHYARRALLRRGGAVLAGAAGVAVLGKAGAAEAAAGDPVLAGTTNDSGAATTALSGGAAVTPTLALTNPATAGSFAAPSLRLVSSAATEGLDPGTGRAGDLAASGDLLWYAHTTAAPTADAAVGAVYTSAFANHLSFVTPRRVLDTRAGAALEGGAPNDRRTRVVGGSFDEVGRLRAGRALVLDLSGLVTAGAGVFGNLTVVGPLGGGNLAAYPTPAGPVVTDGSDRPAVSNLNFVRGQAIANFALVALGDLDRITIYTTTTAHVLFDVAAFSVFEPFSASDPGAARTAGRTAGRPDRL